MWVLEEYRVEYNPTRIGWQKIRCFNDAAHPHGDRNPSGSVSIEFGYYHCFSCELEGDGYQLLRHLRGWDVKQVNDAFGGELIPEDEGDIWI